MQRMSLFAAHRVTILLLALSITVRSAEEDDDEEESDSEANTTKPYVPASVEGLHWVENFDGEVFSRWTMSDAEKYNGKWKVEKRMKEALIGDVGLLVPEEAKHYGISTHFPKFEGKKDGTFVVQFEAKFQDGLSCGGSYIKLFDGADNKEFKDDTPYVIMFGPDKCGSTDKVHFILRHKNPVSGVWEEKHSKDTPSVPHDQLSHLYGLVIRPDNSYEMLVDGEAKISGNLLTTMNPPVNPPKEIDDPEDKKPTDWVDEAKIDDPAAKKPDDWDEDAPMQIVDPKASKPSGWVDDAPKKIPDPEASKPEDWDDEEDGEWEAPIVDNPDCKVGCGKWEPPKISNPEYKGKWYAQKIDNPEYKGVWKPRLIENPHYFVDETPYILPALSAVGIDIWTMSKGIMFDNMVISSDADKAKTYADQSFKIRKELEELQNPKPSGSFSGGFWDYLADYGVPVAVTAGVILVATLSWCLCRGGGAPPPPPAPTKKDAKKDEKKEGEGKTEKKEDSEEKENKENKEEEKKETKKEKKEAEGGLGMTSDD